MTALPNPYKYVVENGLYVFNTTAGIKYICQFYDSTNVFDPTLGIYEIRVYSFSFYPDTGDSTSDQYDRRISDTICQILSDFFSKNPYDIIGFVCQNTDERDILRYRLFKQWHSRLKDRYDLKSLSLKKPAVLYGGILTIRNFEHSYVLNTYVLSKIRPYFASKYGQYQLGT